MKNFWQELNKPIIALAPMAGITDSAFRLLCKEFGADVVYSEMISAEGLFYNSKKTRELLKFNKKEKPMVIQLFGKNPVAFANAAAFVSKLGIDGLDINFGCPARKVFGHGSGAALMNNLDVAYEIIKAVLDNTSLPVSVKCRSSVKGVTALDFIKKIKDLPISAIMIHGRSYEQKFNGPVDYEIIKRVKKIFNGVVLANGGMKNPADIEIMLKQTGADGVGLAQGVLGRPWLFKQVKDYLKNGDYQELDFKEVKKTMLRHVQLTYRLKGKRAGYEMRKHLCWYVRDFAGAGEIRKKLVETSSLEAVKKVLKNI